MSDAKLRAEQGSRTCFNTVGNKLFDVKGARKGIDYAW